MYKFKVRDLITGRPEAPYTITTKDSVCEILSTKEGFFCDELSVRLVSHKKYKEELGKVFIVCSCYFTIYKETNNKETNNFRRVT